jgi:glycosyltransferase involved in cell wall biosynthesis
MESSRVLVLCFDPLTEAMPGPAIRSWHLALELAGAGHQVVLAGTAGASRVSPVAAMEVRAISGGADLDELAGWCDAVFAPTSVVRRHPAVVSCGRPLCIDMYIPTHLENLEPQGAAGGDEHVAAVDHQVAVINDDLRHGDFFLCASERQRDFWLGSLASLGRVNPATYAVDASLRTLIDVVPFGLDAGPLPPAGEGRAVLRAAFPAIGADDPVVLWGGGVYNWFDPLSLVEAVDRLKARRPLLRLVFLGMRNPNPGIPEMRMAVATREMADRLGLTGSHVFFNEGWVPYDQRGAYLAGADLAVSTHQAHIETRFSFRTRVLDYLWAGLPTVLTGGDTLSDDIASAGLGVAVPAGDPDAIAAGIDALLDHPPDRAAVRAYGERYAWGAVAGPLLAWAARPTAAPDRDRARSTRPDAGGGGPATGADKSGAGSASSVRTAATGLGRRLPPPVRRRLAAVARRLGVG